MNAPTAVEGLHVSVSQIKTWLRCPRQYEFKYIIGAEPEFVPMALAWGSAHHDALALYFNALRAGSTASVEEVKQRFVDVMNLSKQNPVPLQDDEDGMSFEDAVAKGLQMLEVALAHPSAQVKVLAVEQPFTVDLHDPDTGEVLDIRLKGIVDLVIEEDGNRVIVEHKTAARKYAADQLMHDVQISAYSYAATQLGWGEVGLKFSIVTKVKNPVVQLEDLRRDDTDVEDFLRTAIGVLKAIDAGISFPIRSWACKGCQFRNRCRASEAST